MCSRIDNDFAYLHKWCQQSLRRGKSTSVLSRLFSAYGNLFLDSKVERQAFATYALPREIVWAVNTLFNLRCEWDGRRLWMSWQDVGHRSVSCHETSFFTHTRLSDKQLDIAQTRLCVTWSTEKWECVSILDLLLVVSRDFLSNILTSCQPAKVNRTLSVENLWMYHHTNAAEALSLSLLKMSQNGSFRLNIVRY